MKAFVVLVCVLVAVRAMTWEEFKLKHGKKYSNITEENLRQKIYAENLKMIEEHNDLFKRGEVSYTLAVNHFADLTSEEFYKHNQKSSNDSGQAPIYKIIGNPPAAIDWSQKGAVTDVKLQEQCEGGWAFATTGAIEAQFFLKSGNLVSFSEQQIIDCSLIYGNSGCWHGEIDVSFTYIRDNGLQMEEDYPYTAETGESCAYNAKTTVLKTLNYFVEIPSGDENALMDAVGNISPVATSMNTPSDFMFYSSGVYAPRECSTSSPSHGILVVGYGAWKGSNYWLLKNSYGAGWGLNGYMWLIRDEGNMCGIASKAFYPIL